MDRKVTQRFRAVGSLDEGKNRVLVVDDDAALARTIRRVLGAAGYEVSVAENGHDAAQALAADGFTVVLTDIKMPQMGGLELLEVVRAYDLDIPVILMTGAPTVESASDAVRLGAYDYLPKPFRNEVLTQTVDRASRIRRMAHAKRQALELGGRDPTEAGDLTALRVQFERALEQLWVAFQPIVDLEAGRVHGFEALVRTREPSMPNPGVLLAAAERLDRVHDLGRAVRSLAAEAFARAPEGAQLFVNLHARDLVDSDLYKEDAPLSKIADRVVLEVTERASLDDIKDLHIRIPALRALDFRIALDDLGAGYAGLTSFVTLKPEVVKLDMTLVRGIHLSKIRQGVVSSMAQLCMEMGMKVVAEGVEDSDERDCLRGFGCDLLQGYLFAKPGPPFPRAVLS